MWGDASDPFQAWEVAEAPTRWRASGSTGPSRSSPATPDEHSFLLSNGESPVRRNAKTRTVTDQEQEIVDMTVVDTVHPVVTGWTYCHGSRRAK